MSETIDTKVLEMQFDNSQFEKNVSTSLSTLDKLKQSLNLDGATKGFSTLSDKIKSVNMSGLSSAVETVQTKFSALEVIGVTALANITNSAVNAGKRLISSLSTDQIMAGWTKFGDKTTSVATLVSQGYKLEKVNSLLDKLNWYTDETSYNFTDMVANIAKFTSTGQDLDKSVTAMEGIANWAALSGQNAQKASLAMYQLSQAMGKGVLKYDDWRSIQNASMDTVEFREHALQAAEALGVIRKEADDTFTILESGKNFTMSEMFTSDALSRGAWFTSDVMMDTFNQYSSAVDKIYEFVEATDLTASEVLSARKALEEGKESFDEFYDSLDRSDISKKELKEFVKGLDDFGVKALKSAQEARTFADVIDATKDAVSTAWMKTFEIIIGNYEQATRFWTDLANELYDAFAEPVNSLNELLDESLGEMGGRELLVESFWNIWNAALDTMSLVGEAWRDVFPATTAQQLYDTIVKIRDFTAGLTLSDDIADKLSRTLKGVFSALDIVKTVLSTFVGTIFPPLKDGLSGIVSNILSVTANIGDWLVVLDETIKKSDKLQNAINSIAKFIKQIETYVESAMSVIVPLLEQFYNFAIKDFTTKAWELFASVLDRIKTRFSGLPVLLSGIGGILSKIVKLIGSIISALSNAGVFRTIKEFGSWLINTLGKGLDSLIERISNANFKGIFDFINGLLSIGIGANIFKFIKDMDGGLGKILELITGLGDKSKGFSGFKGMLEGLTKALEPLQERLKAATIKSIAEAVALLAGSLFLISLIDSEKLSEAIGGISVLFAELMGSMGVLTALTSGSKFSGLTSTLIGLSLAILILAAALKSIASLDKEELINGITGIGALIGELTLSVAALNANSYNLDKGAGQLILLAVAVLILTKACKELSTLDMDGLIVGLTGVGALLAELSLFVTATKFGNNMMSGALGLLALSAAILILVKAVGDLGQMDENQLVYGIGAVGALITELAAFTKISDKTNMISTGLGMIAIAAAIKILSGVIIELGSIPFDNVITGLTAIGGALAAIAIAVSAMPKQNMLKIGVSLLLISAAITIIANALKSLSIMSGKEMETGLISLGGALLAIAVAANAMKGALSGAAAIAIISASLLLLAPALKILGSMSLTSTLQALIALAGVFVVLGVAAYALAPALPVIIGLAAALTLIGAAVALFGVGLVAAGAGLSMLAVGLSLLAVSIGSSLKAIISALIDSATEIGTALIVLIDVALDVLAEAAPKLADTLLKLIVQILQSIVERVPELVSIILNLISSVLDELIARVPEIVGKIVTLVATIFKAAIDALKSFGTDGIVDAIESIGMIAAFMFAMAGLSKIAPSAAIGIAEFAGLIAELGLAFAALGALKQIPGLEWLISEGSEFADKIGHAVGSFVGNIIGGIGEGASNSLPAIGENLSAFYSAAEPFFEGVKEIDASVFSGIDSLASAILKITASDILEGITRFITGGSSISSFAEQLPELGAALTGFADNLGDNFDAGKIEAASNLASMLAVLAKDEIPTTGGVLHWLTGENSLSAFGGQLETLATGLSSFADNIGDNFDEGKIQAATNMASMLAALAKNEIPTTGGVLQWLAGQKDLGAFGEQITSFGEGLNSFAQSIGDDITPEKIKIAEDAGKMLVALSSASSELDNGGFFTSGALTNFGYDLSSFGSSLAEFFASQNDVDTTKAESVVTSLQGVTEGIQAISQIDTSGVSTFIQSLEDAMQIDLSTFVTSITNSVGEIEAAAQATVDAFSISLQNNTAGASEAASAMVSNIVSAITTKTPQFMIAGAALLNAVNLGISGSADMVTGGVSAIIVAVIGTINSQSGSLNASGVLLVMSLNSGMTSMYPVVTTTMLSMLAALVGAIRSQSGAFQASGVLLGTALVSGMQSKNGAIKSAFNGGVSGAVATVRGYRGSMYAAGSYIGEGLAQGLESKVSRVEAAAARLSKAAQKATEVANKIHSPAKVYVRYGKYMGEGLAIGIEGCASLVAGSADLISKEAQSHMTSAVARISNILQNGIDAEPTISPVLDLSNVENGVGEIGDLLDLRTSIGVLGGLNAIDYRMQSRYQRATNDDVVSAINGLNRKLGNIKHDTFNINGITYDDGSNIAGAVKQLIRAARMERRA